MPCLEISMPRCDEKIIVELSQRLTETFAEITPFPAEIFGIKFNLYEYGTVASGGKLCSSDDKRPYLHLLLYSPRLKRAVKQAVVASFTKDFCDVMEKPDWKPVIHICEHPYDNVGVEGQLLSDAYESCRESKFYYNLPD